MHVAHGCNLACESCSHYSNQGHKGILTLEQAEAMIAAWHFRLRPQAFNLLGGEPTINPQLADFFSLAHQFWPDAHLKLITNGFFLHRHPQLPIILKKIPNSTICLSIHYDTEEYKEQLKPVFLLLNSWIEEHGIKVSVILSFKNWTRRYHGQGDHIKPFTDHDKRKSWENCPAKYCPQLFDGKIWKCAPLAYLKLQKEKYTISTDWAPYLSYQPIETDASDKELEAFLLREDEPYCRMCPAASHQLKL